MSPHSARLARVAALSLPFLVAAAAAGRSPDVDGWSFVWTTTSTAKGARTTAMQVRLIPNRVRVDYTTPTPGMAAGNYILLDAESGRMTMVSPREKSAMILPLGGLMSAMGGMGEAGLLKMDVTDVSVSVDELGPGESMLGHSTERYRVQHSYSMSVAVMGFRRSSKDISDTEIWMATDLSVAERKALEEFGRNFSQSFSATGIGGEGMRKLTEELQHKMPKGFPLKQVAKRTSVDQGGKETSSTTTTLVTEYKRVSLDARLFEVPEGYTIREMRGVVDTASQVRKDAR